LRLKRSPGGGGAETRGGREEIKEAGDRKRAMEDERKA